MEFDKSEDPKMAIMITGQSLFWTAIDYEVSFVYHNDNKIGTYSGTPDVFTGIMVNGRLFLLKILPER